MLRRLLPVLLFFFLPVCLLNGQKVRVNQATLQTWSGGVCCIHGVNYWFSLRIRTGGRELKLDSLYIEGQMRPVTAEIIHKQARQKSYDDVELSVSFRYGQAGREAEVDLDQPVDRSIKPVLIYHIGKKRRTYTFTGIHALEPIAFP